MVASHKDPSERLETVATRYWTRVLADNGPEARIHDRRRGTLLFLPRRL